MTLLLPALLVAPVERDIRIVSVVNPFYAAALPSFAAFLQSQSAPSASREEQENSSLIIAEGHRALRTVILTRHLQRILDSLPNRAQDARRSDTDKPPTPHPSNILAVSACPGISRRDTVGPFLGTGTDERGWSLAYVVLLAPLVLLTKSSAAALQTVLHVLFLPTPLKRAQAKVDAAADEEARQAEAAAAAGTEEQAGGSASVPAEAMPRRVGHVEVLKPGALYRECAVVRLEVPRPPEPPRTDEEKNKEGKERAEESMLEDDGEFGGEAVGRAVWEWYEARLKEWEARDKARVQAEEEAAAKEQADAEAKEAREATAQGAAGDGGPGSDS